MYYVFKQFKHIKSITFRNRFVGLEFYVAINEITMNPVLIEKWQFLGILGVY